ncbi:MAG: DUF819 family protein [Planctomycetota bacterium]
MIQDDAVIFGLLMVILGFVFVSSKSDFKPFKVFYRFVPMLLMCYFLPSLLTLSGLINVEESELYFVATRYLLPACLVLLTLSIDLKGIMGLGPKAVVMFLTGTVGVVIGGPLAILIIGFFDPELVGGNGPDALWKGLSTIAGSWIGGGANQVAMKEIYQPSEQLYSAMVSVDVIVAELWMFFLILGVGQSARIDKWMKADASNIQALQEKLEKREAETSRIPQTVDLIAIGAVAFGAVAYSKFAAYGLAPTIKSNFAWATRFSLDSEFFWLIVLSTTIGLGLSFTKLRRLEHCGASKIGTVFIYILVAVIGMRMDVMALFKQPELFLVGIVWMLIHVVLLFFVAWLIRAPYFFLAVGSKANIGGAASAPVVAGAFHPSLAPVGVLLAVLGYALGTYAAWICSQMMRAVSPADLPIPPT